MELVRQKIQQEAREKRKVQLFKQVLRLWANGRLRNLARAMRTWSTAVAVMAAEERAKGATIRKQDHDLRVFALQSKVRDLEERLHEISLTSDSHAALVSEKAFNRELAGANIQLRDEVNRLKELLLNVSNTPPQFRNEVLDRLSDREQDSATQMRTIRALKEQVQRLQLSIQSPATAHTAPNIEKDPRQFYKGYQKDGSQGTHSGLPSDPEKAEAGAAKREQDPHLVTTLLRNGVKAPTLMDLRQSAQLKRRAQSTGAHGTKKGERQETRWPKAHHRQLTRDDARRIILGEVKRMRASFVTMQTDKEYFREKLADEVERNTQLSMAMHALQEKFMTQEHRLVKLLDQKIAGLE